jgi:hypothetical protein
MQIDALKDDDEIAQKADLSLAPLRGGRARQTVIEKFSDLDLFAKKKKVDCRCFGGKKECREARQSIKKL